MQGPKITITKAPTIDQSDLEFLYPIPDPDIRISHTELKQTKSFPDKDIRISHPDNWISNPPELKQTEPENPAKTEVKGCKINSSEDPENVSKFTNPNYIWRFFPGISGNSVA